MFEYNATLIRVVDADTLDCELDLGFDVFVKRRCRLYGIDAFESRTRDLEEKKRGLAAKARLIELLENNNNRFIVQSHEIGKYGRCLSTIILDDDRDVGEILMEEGHAYAYHGGNKEEARAKAIAILAERNNDG